MIISDPHKPGHHFDVDREWMNKSIKLHYKAYRFLSCQKLFTPVSSFFNSIWTIRRKGGYIGTRALYLFGSQVKRYHFSQFLDLKLAPSG